VGGVGGAACLFLEWCCFVWGVQKGGGGGGGGGAERPVYYGVGRFKKCWHVHGHEY